MHFYSLIPIARQTRSNYQIKIPAGHEFIVSVDRKHYDICDDKVLFMDYVSDCLFTAMNRRVNMCFAAEPAQGHGPGQADLCR